MQIWPTPVIFFVIELSVPYLCHIKGNMIAVRYRTVAGISWKSFCNYQLTVCTALWLCVSRLFEDKPWGLYVIYKKKKEEIFGPDLINTPPHWAQSRPMQMQYAPHPHLLDCTEHTDVKSSCFTLWFLTSFLHRRPVCHSCNLNTTGCVTTTTEVTQWDVRGATEWQDEARSQWPLFLQEEKEKSVTTAHNEGNQWQNWETRRKLMFMRG